MLGFLIAFAAGFVTPHLEAPLARPLARSLSARLPIEENELRLVAFAIALIGAGLLCAVFNSGSPLGVAVGATLGYFALRILSAAQKALENRGS